MIHLAIFGSIQCTLDHVTKHTIIKLDKLFKQVFSSQTTPTLSKEIHRNLFDISGPFERLSYIYIPNNRPKTVKYIVKY